MDYRWITVPQAARRLDTTMHAVVQLIHARALRAKFIGRRWFVEPASVETYRYRRRAERLRATEALGGEGGF